MERCIVRQRDKTREYDAALSVYHHISALRGSTFQNVSCDRLQGLQNDLVAPLKFNDRFDVSKQSKLAAPLLRPGNEAAARHGIGIVGADAERIAEITECLERDDLG